MRSKVTNEKLTQAVLNSKSVMEVLRYLGLKEAGGSHSHYKNRILSLKLDISHFEKSPKNVKRNRKSSDTILVKRNTGCRTKSTQLRKAMVESGVEYKCKRCNQEPNWLGSNLTLDVDHINQDWLDDRLENLRFLCPNCHSQFSRNLLNK